MKIDTVIKALRERCPSFQRRVGGWAEYARISDDSALKMPCAYVVPMADSAGENESQNSYRQNVRDKIGILVALPNDDHRGQQSANLQDDIRKELNKALLGWCVTDEYEGLVYDGGQLFEMSRAASWWSYEYFAEFMIGDEDVGDPETWHQQELDALGSFDSMKITVDAIDPHDPNFGPHGPDGVPEGIVEIELKKD